MNVTGSTLTREDALHEGGEMRQRRPMSQQLRYSRERLPAWMKQLPYLRVPPVREDFTLIDRVEMRRVLGETDPDVIKSIERDLDLLESDLLRYFIRRDADAAINQNRYRLFQIGYIVLAMLATVVGSLMVMALNSSPRWVPVLSFIETGIALLATYMSNLSNRIESPLHSWIDNRRRAENLRREFFRYLMNMPPYDTLTGAVRRMTLSKRAALINQGQMPDDAIGQEGK